MDPLFGRVVRAVEKVLKGIGEVWRLEGGLTRWIGDMQQKSGMNERRVRTSPDWSNGRWVGDALRRKPKGISRRVLVVAAGLLLVLTWLGGVLQGVERGASQPLGLMRDEKTWRCSNLLVEIGTGDTEGIQQFVENEGDLQEWLIDNKLLSSNFCVELFDARAKSGKLLEDFALQLRNHVEGVRVHAGTLLSNFAGFATVPLQPPLRSLDSSSMEKTVVGNYSLYNFEPKEPEIRELQVKVEDLWEVVRRAGLGVQGAVVVRVRSSANDAKVFLRTLLGDSRLCYRIDRLVLHVQNMDSFMSPMEIPRTALDLKSELEMMVRFLGVGGGCRTEVELNIETEEQETVKGTSSVFYSLVAGKTTLEERVCPATSTWMRGVNYGDAAIVTNHNFTENEPAFNCLQGHVGVAASPSFRETEKVPENMQSWSHLVRVRASWDLFMKEDDSKLFLVLLDDDTFPFTDTMGGILSSKIDPYELQWGGNLELLRVDNGDTGRFWQKIRDAYRSEDGGDCRFDDEDYDENTASCSNTFCNVCSPIPQGGFTVLSRRIVEEIRPHIEECERETQALCERCGSQRLYYCLHNKLEGEVKAIDIEGVFRNPWRGERSEFSAQSVNYPVAIHQLQENSPHLHTGFVQQDFEELYELVRHARRRAAVNAGDAWVTQDDLNRVILCDNVGYFRYGRCYPTLAHPNWSTKDVLSWSPADADESAYEQSDEGNSYGERGQEGSYDESGQEGSYEQRGQMGNFYQSGEDGQNPYDESGHQGNTQSGEDDGHSEREQGNPYDKSRVDEPYSERGPDDPYYQSREDDPYYHKGQDEAAANARNLDAEEAYDRNKAEAYERSYRQEEGYYVSHNNDESLFSGRVGEEDVDVENPLAEEAEIDK